MTKHCGYTLLFWLCLMNAADAETLIGTVTAAKPGLVSFHCAAAREPSSWTSLAAPDPGVSVKLESATEAVSVSLGYLDVNALTGPVTSARFLLTGRSGAYVFSPLHGDQAGLLPNKSYVLAVTTKSVSPVTYAIVYECKQKPKDELADAAALLPLTGVEPPLDYKKVWLLPFKS